jgi:hypothetical protein
VKANISSTAKARLIRSAFYLLLLLALCSIPFALAQRNATSYAIDAAKMSLAVGVSAGEAPEAPGSPTPNPEATAVVVWDQYNNVGTAVTLSATFTDSPAMNSDLADDFVVQDYAWLVRWIDVDGAYFNGPGPANSFTVTFYYDNGGFPGSQVYTTFASWEQNGSTFRVHVCDNYPCQGQSLLNPGTYWVEIQANMTAKCCGEWGWTDRTVTNVNAAVWRNPSGFFGSCMTWSRRGVICGLDPSEPDQVYRIYANVIPVCSVDSTNLGCGGTINFQPTDFSIHMSCPVDPATVHTSSFMVNNIQPDSFTLLNNNTTISFHYNTTPVVPGLNTMQVPAGGFNCVCGTVLEFTCSFTYQPSTPTPTPTATVTPVACVLFENFDFVTPPALPAGWTAGNGINPDGILWQTSNSGVPSPPADSLPNAAWVNDPAAVSDKYLYSPPIIVDQLENASLMFRNNYSLEASRDGGVLEISIDGGAFQDAGGFIYQGGYNGTISTCCGNPLAGRQAWTGSSGGFITTWVGMPQGHTSVLRWRMGSDASNAGEGWRIDTVQIVCERPTPTSTPIVTASPTPTATATPMGTATQTPTATVTPATPTPTGRPAPTPRLRPTPPPRP